MKLGDGGSVHAEWSLLFRFFLRAVRDGSCDQSSLPFAGEDLQLAVQLADALANTEKPHTQAHAGGVVGRGHANAFIADL